MRLVAPELAYVRSCGLYITQKCDGCGRLLNQNVHYTITGRSEVFCSSPCRDNAFFADRHEVMKRATPGKCTYCGGSLESKKRGSIFCDDVCRKALSRKNQRIATRELEKSRTPTQLNQSVGDPKTVGLGDCIASGPQRPRNAPSEVTADCGLSAELEPATFGEQ